LGQPVDPQWQRTAPPAGTISTGSGRTFEATEGRTMTIGGTASVAFLMLMVMFVGAWFGWQQVTTTPAPTVNDPNAATAAISSSAWLWGPLVVGLAFALVTAFVPKIARFTSLPYALAEGIVLGDISHLYDSQSQGIAVQALLATSGVFLTMLALYGLRILRATPKFVKGVVAATFGILAMYMVGWIASMFGADSLRFWNSSSPMGIGISLLIVGVAAFNLILDFDLIERGAKNHAPAYMEWYGAFSLMVTLVWLYLEMLRLLSKLRD
jgi:uncharacterized YccA/Bax inhibitor family protein